jgi:hypothetical protein
MEMAAKGKKRRADMDECKDVDDMDDDDEDDEDDEDDAPPPKAKKKARKFASDEDMAKAIATAVATALAPLMKGNDMQVSKSPHLMVANKDGSTEKMQSIDLDSVLKSVSQHPRDASGAWRANGDSGTATLIKAIHKNPAFRINPNEIDKLQ